MAYRRAIANVNMCVIGCGAKRYSFQGNGSRFCGFLAVHSSVESQSCHYWNVWYITAVSISMHIYHHFSSLCIVFKDLASLFLH
jgi:hypothetical protein